MNLKKPKNFPLLIILGATIIIGVVAMVIVNRLFD